MESSAYLIANKIALKDPKKRQKIYDVISLCKGVVEAKSKVHIFIIMFYLVLVEHSVNIYYYVLIILEIIAFQYIVL